MRAMRGIAGTLLLLTACSNALIPEDLVTFMQIFFASIPTVKKGTDSRFGIGFRFGPLADAQVVWELGPQTHTQPLADVSQLLSDGKRHAPAPAPDPGWVHDDPLLRQPVLPHLEDNSIQGRALGVAAGGEWLSRWRTGVSRARGEAPTPGHSSTPGRQTKDLLHAVVPTTASPALHKKPPAATTRLRAVLMTTASPAPTYSRMPTTSPASTQRPRRQGRQSFLQTLQQLWVAGARAAKG